jgi:Mlc titration factor MtfA (ptsG expression regulator)
MREADIFKGLTAVERARLRELTTLFLHRKAINGVQDFTLTTEMAIAVAAQACLLILNLGFDSFDGWVEVVIYPGAFRVDRDSTDSMGLVTRQSRILSGESWLRGPVILSWNDVAAGLNASSGHNVVVHEFAHKLDMLDGRANGMPPLHFGMVRHEWATAFSEAFSRLQQRASYGYPLDFNAYGATSPAEFFAVASEYFFTDPHALRYFFPAVYDQLELFYGQRPAERKFSELSASFQSVVDLANDLRRAANPSKPSPASSMA